MKHIAILSDTHGLLRDEMKTRLSGVDAIIHAGDIDTQEIVDILRSYSKTYIVRGNNDREWAENLPQSLAFVIEGLHFFVTHDKKDVPKDLSGVDVVIYGHSHKYSMKEKDGVLWLNPGSCGRRRFHQEITFCFMDVDQRKYQIKKILIPQEG